MIQKRTAWRPAPAEACRGRTRTPSAPASWGQRARRRHHRRAAASRRAAPHERTGRRPLPRGASATQRTALYRSDDDLQAVPTALEAMADDTRSPQPPPEADAASHPALLNATRNETHARMDMLLEAGLCECDPAVHAHDHGTDPVPSHQVVLDAARDQDPARAELALHELLTKAPLDARRQSSPAVTVIGTCN
ncbi:FCD domain-containing protein [Streptomyces sp. NPDC058430]|uniref:FCD domain-containing protein n=1 Tax=Streptomyces sp. NPDC058430 TaxID=3346495 RepID=UPI0036663EE8